MVKVQEADSSNKKKKKEEGKKERRRNVGQRNITKEKWKNLRVKG